MIRYTRFSTFLLLFTLNVPMKVLAQKETTLFSRIAAEHSNIHFKNELTNYEKFNVFTSQYFYNGGGVALGDINNDGWEDFFVSNDFFEFDYLYLNNGDKTFTEQTDIKLDGISSGSTAWGDYDNDGDLDVLTSGEDSSGNQQLRVYGQPFFRIVKTGHPCPVKVKPGAVPQSIPLVKLPACPWKFFRFPYRQTRSLSKALYFLWLPVPCT